MLEQLGLQVEQILGYRGSTFFAKQQTDDLLGETKKID